MTRQNHNQLGNPTGHAATEAILDQAPLVRFTNGRSHTSDRDAIAVMYSDPSQTLQLQTMPDGPKAKDYVLDFGRGGLGMAWIVTGDSNKGRSNRYALVDGLLINVGSGAVYDLNTCGVDQIEVRASRGMNIPNAALTSSVQRVLIYDGVDEWSGDRNRLEHAAVDQGSGPFETVRDIAERYRAYEKDKNNTPVQESLWRLLGALQEQIKQLDPSFKVRPQ